MTKVEILAEIRRTAVANGGRPLGMDRFAAVSGIREADWKGRYWARWSDAVREAGYEPNELTARLDDETVFDRLISEVRRLGRMPTEPELQMARRQDPTFPSLRVFRRLGSKADRVRLLASYCCGRDGYADVLSMIAAPVHESGERAEDGTLESGRGFVYLLKSGSYYKIGRSADVGRRRYDLAIQLPEPITEVHVIATDDPAGIERYWHTRFSERRKNGEWFQLTKADVGAFKRRRFM